jgi:hypothetical protein
MATSETAGFLHVEGCSLCGDVVPCIGPPKAGVCADCTDVLVFGHGLIDARIATLTKALRGLVEALPRCSVKNCNEVRTNPAYCDQHRTPGTVDAGYLPAFRAAQEALSE